MIHKVRIYLTIFFVVFVPLSAVPVDNGEVLINGNFNTGDLTGWKTEHEGPGTRSLIQEITYSGSAGTSLRANSLSGSNYYMKYAQYITISSPSDLNMTFSFNWKQERIESTYGVATTHVLFLDSGGSVIGNIVFLHQATNFYTEHDWCNNSRTSYCASSERGSSFSWRTERIDLRQALSRMSGVDKGRVRKVKVLLQSYNNAGSGTDAYWDDVNLIKQ